jgi:hypothetical protein
MKRLWFCAAVQRDHTHICQSIMEKLEVSGLAQELSRLRMRS